MMREVEGVASLDAQEFAVDTALVAIVAAHDLHAGVGPPDAQRDLAAIAAMGADGADVVHLPWPRLVAIGAGGERADRADVNAHAALFALQMVFFIGRDDAAGAAVLDAERPHVHALAADANAAVAENAARPVEVHHRRPLLLFAMVLQVDEFRFGCAVLEGHVLQFAFAAGIADRAVERMVRQQQLEHRLARLLDLVALGEDHHALGDGRGARRLQLGHFLDLDQTHAARAAERQAGIVAERRHLDALALAGLDEERPRGSREFLTVDRERYVRHKKAISN